MQSPLFPYSNGTPVIAQLTDDNGDGRVGTGDVPDVIFTHGYLTAVDGRDGREIFTTATRVRDAVAAGDLDGDGVVELVAFDDNLSLVAFRSDGSLAWRVPIFQVNLSQCLGIADMDGVGGPEIYFTPSVRSADGGLVWEAPRSSSLRAAIVIAVDLLPSTSGLELFAKNTCHAATGAVLWSRTDIPLSFPAVGDLDEDGSGEVVLVARNGAPEPWTEIHVLDRFGTSISPPLVVPSPGAAAAAPTLVDLDGDRRLEIVVPMGFALQAFDWTGTELVLRWTSPVVDDSCCGGASAYDMDADGVPEILYRGSEGFYVLDGTDGSILDWRPGRAGTHIEYPVVADIDNDGLPEIVVTGGDDTNKYVTAYECGVPVPTRCIWNQHSYHVTNVNDDGTIPVVEVPPWTAGFGSQEQEGRACCASGSAPWLPDISICEGGSANLDATSLADPACVGGNTFTWLDELGAVIGTGATLLVSPSTSTTYEVTIDCAGQPACGSGARVNVTVDLPPLFSVLAARDPDTCNVGLELTWDAATFRDPSGTGVYDVYRSETSCLDAMTLAPVATGLTALRWVDTATVPGRSYYYVVQAEDARLSTPCPQGPHHGGAVNAGLVCVGPIMEAPDAYTPALLGWALRGSHVGHVVTMTWPGSRALLPGEHFHVLKGYDASGFTRVNLEGDLSTTWTETDISRPLQFFDIRIANTCEIESLDDEPPGRDPP